MNGWPYQDMFGPRTWHVLCDGGNRAVCGRRLMHPLPAAEVSGDFGPSWQVPAIDPLCARCMQIVNKVAAA